MGTTTVRKHQKVRLDFANNLQFVKDQTDQIILAADRFENKVSIFHDSQVYANTKSSRWPRSSSKCVRPFLLLS
ncbi:hypothetical protein BOTNAR_0023g00130 [Botryotinia narcissicola]|uniref:Uncharacterized protein n=1 Tax=Botryotinia narcissicola TaxID=278944 RepID=A0A4Z1J493_9HELO|nr:hypothetical protein BOTNAR_0023g00130 [Botryotinia narcissicola]